MKMAGTLEHGAKAAKTFSSLIKQTAPKENKPGKNRSLVIGIARGANKPVILVSPKKPTNALSELKTMSKKLGTVTPLAIGQVVFQGNVVHVKALKNANEAKVKSVFLEYYHVYKVTPPSIKVKLWQPNEWEAVEFEEDQNDSGAVDEDQNESGPVGVADESGEGDDGFESGEEIDGNGTETETEESAAKLGKYRARMTEMEDAFKKFQAKFGARSWTQI
jgi:hypothetical protein